MENSTNQKMGTPQAIVVAGVLIMVAILLTNKGGTTNTNNKAVPKTLSEQVGITGSQKEAFALCIKNTDTDTLKKNIDDNVDKAMKGVPSGERGTPYAVVIGLNGVKTDIRGADSYENVKKIVDNATLGKVGTAYTGDLSPITTEDHIFGNPDAIVKIVEYSDFECPYCKMFHPTLKRIVTESNGQVAWIYRNWPLHQHSLEKLTAAECVAKVKGNDAYWKYADLLFGLLKTGDESVSDQL